MNKLLAESSSIGRHRARDFAARFLVSSTARQAKVRYPMCWLLDTFSSISGDGSNLPGGNDEHAR